MSFYCNDYTFTPILNNPKAYVNKLRQYNCLIGLDVSPFDNMPLWIQKSQIGLNIGITYYYGSCGIKIIPNIRIGSDATLSSLEAYPHHTLIAIGTNGFVKNLKNRNIFAIQLQKVVDILEPTGICVYGSIPDEIFNYVYLKGIPVYQYDSYTIKKNISGKVNFLEVTKNEGK